MKEVVTFVLKWVLMLWMVALTLFVIGFAIAVVLKGCSVGLRVM